MKKNINKRFFFEPIQDFLEITIQVSDPLVTGYEKSYELLAVFCDGECFMDFVCQNNFTNQILDTPEIDKAIVTAQNDFFQERMNQFRDELQASRAKKAIAA